MRLLAIKFTGPDPFDDFVENPTSLCVTDLRLYFTNCNTAVVTLRTFTFPRLKSLGLRAFYEGSCMDLVTAFTNCSLNRPRLETLRLSGFPSLYREPLNISSIYACCPSVRTLYLDCTLVFEFGVSIVFDLIWCCGALLPNLRFLTLWNVPMKGSVF